MVWGSPLRGRWWVGGVVEHVSFAHMHRSGVITSCLYINELLEFFSKEESGILYGIYTDIVWYLHTRSCRSVWHLHPDN